MMVVTPPVLPPSFEPDGFNSPGPLNGVSRTTTTPPFPVYAQGQDHHPPSQHLPRVPVRLDPEMQKPSLPPTPDPSPPHNPVAFPVQMVALAPPADHVPSSARGYHLEQGLLSPDEYSPPSTGTSPSTNASSSSSQPSAVPSARRRRSEFGVLSELSQSPSKLSPTKSPTKQRGMARSDTLPSLDRLSLTSRNRSQDERARAKSRRSTFAAPVPGPSSVRMVESHSADSRARLRSTPGPGLGGAKLVRYSTLATEYPTGPRMRRMGPEAVTSTTLPARAFPGSASDFDADLDFGGPEGLEAKVVLLGSQGVGKTSLILRLTTGSYSAIPAPASLEGSLYKRKLVHDGVPVKLQIWDTAGQERFRSMAPIYYRGAHVCILVYDTTDRDSFMDVRSWLDELNSKASKDMIIYVVGAKTDLDDQRVVTLGEARRTIRTWLKPAPPESELLLDNNSLSPLTSSRLFRSTSTRARTESSSGISPPRARPHSMHGLASLMAAASDFADWDPSPSGVSTPSGPALVSPTPAPTVHFPSDITSSGSGSSVSASTVTSPSSRPSVPPRRKRVSFHSPAPPSGPISGTTAETAVASTANSTSRVRQTSNRFSISGFSGVLGLSRSPTTSEALANLELLAEANDLPPRPTNSRSSLTPLRVRVESSPMLGDAKRGEEWSRGWGRGEGPGAANALEEFGAVVRSQKNDRNGKGAGSHRPRSGSLGCDSRLYPTDSRDEDEEKPPQWGVEVEGVRLGEVSSLTGEGVELLCRSIATVLVTRKDKIERERTLRRKDSVMLTDTTKKDARKPKGRYGCCA
ncbi:hypothetical protein CspHIS471_0406980 [Cutaneotrichosporon sp. HIS471]|nr:hypothetical protein CspHIS471_0406980 [Cutaneotrichosporon sp. HIS471]